MRKQHDFFRWILAGLTLAGVTVAASTTPTAPPTPPPPAGEVALATAQAQPPRATSKQSGQIWECVTNGVKTFSNNPCGTQATRVALRPINTMKSTPVNVSARANQSQPRDTKEYADQNLYSEQEMSGQGFEENSYSDVQGYPGVQGFVYLPQHRANHNHRPAHHHDSTSEPHRPAPRAQNSTPAPQRPVAAPRKN